MKKLILSFIALLIINIGHAQQFDQSSLNELKAKLIAIEKLYNAKEYNEVLKKAKEIEVLAEGFESPNTQNYKVKAYIGLSRFERAKVELKVLYEMNPGQHILEDIASYEYKIDKGVQEEIRRKKQQKLEAERKKEQERLAKIKREREKKEKEEKLERALNGFVLERCTNGCNYTGKLYEPPSYRGDVAKRPTCKACNGKAYVLKYVGHDYLSSKEKKDLTSHFNAYKVIKRIDEKEKNSISKRISEFKKLETELGLKPELVPYKYSVIDRSKNYYQYKSKLVGYVDARGKLILTVEKINESLEKSYGAGTKVNHHEFFTAFNEGIAIISVVEKNLMKSSCLINKDGEVIAKLGSNTQRLWQPSFDIFSDGLAKIRANTKKGYKIAYLNTKGDLVIPFQDLYQATRFQNGIAKVQKKRDGKWLYMDKKGNIRKSL